MQHTPTPWRLDPSGFVVVGSDNGTIVYSQARAEMRANVAFVVRAVNAHADLVAALEDARDALAFATSTTNSFCEICERHAPKSFPEGEITGPIPHADGCPIGQAEAALAKARGEAADA